MTDISKNTGAKRRTSALPQGWRIFPPSEGTSPEAESKKSRCGFLSPSKIKQKIPLDNDESVNALHRMTTTACRTKLGYIGLTAHQYTSHIVLPDIRCLVNLWTSLYRSGHFRLCSSFCYSSASTKSQRATGTKKRYGGKDNEEMAGWNPLG